MCYIVPVAGLACCTAYDLLGHRLAHEARPAFHVPNPQQIREGATPQLLNNLIVRTNVLSFALVVFAVFATLGRDGDATSDAVRAVRCRLL